MTGEDPSAISASEARLRLLIEVAPDGIFVTRDGVILFVNGAGARILGATDASAILMQPLARFLAPHEREVGAARLASTQPDRLLPVRVYDVTGSTGQTITVEATSLTIEWDGAPAALTFAHDITDRLRMEAQLSRADRLTALGALAAGVAHEINNPLAYISLGIDSLTKLARTMPDANRPRMLELLEDMRGGIARVAAITRDLRTFARDRPEEPTDSADLTAVLASVQRLVAHEVSERATLVVDLPPDLPPVRGAALRLEQVFVNLLINSAQSFEPDQNSGVIEIRARAHQDQRVVVEVTDNGSGIAPELLSRLFDPFFTTKAGIGTGLGLAISQTIVVAAGGEITVETEPGRGTTFRVSLVAVEKAQSIVETNRAVRRARILIIDDEPMVARSISALLADDHDVTTMTSAGDALASLLDGATYDVVLCDLMMPHLTGMDLYERLAAVGQETKLVFMTGAAFTERAREFLASVPNRRIHKPFAIDEFEAILREL